ncbi:13490_t:CDS:2, partial [Entrophospora sp. SA101]
RKINDTLSNLLATTEIEGFNDDQFDLIKRVFEYKLLQLRAGHDNQLDVSLMDENTYTSTVISPDFEFLKICFPGLNENDVPSSKWRRELIYGVGALAQHWTTSSNKG